MKTYPFDSEEEFFYDSGQQLLSQRSGNLVGTATQWTVDDYIWLDGKPIVMVRGSFGPSYTRNLDTQASCDRFGEPGACGIYHVVHDYLPKPVLMLNALSGKVANVALYDDFGHANRVPVIAGTGLPAASTMVADVQLPTGSATRYTARMLYNYVDLPSGVSATVNGGAAVSVASTAQVWSPWTLSSATNPVQVRLSSTACGSECARNGIQTDAIEYRRFELGVTPMWTTLRLPGQQFDEETDLFENWNRFYAADIGQYLSPEPMLQNPAYLQVRAEEGLAMPTYAYASNNPLGRIDRDGRVDIAVPGGPTFQWPDPAVPLLPVATVIFGPPLYCVYNPTALLCKMTGMSPPKESKIDECVAGAVTTIVAMAVEVAARWRCNAWHTKCLGTAFASIPGRCEACRDTCIGKRGRMWPTEDWNGNECPSVQ